MGQKDLSQATKGRQAIDVGLLDALSWVRQTVFPEDLKSGLLACGASPELAEEIAFAFKMTRDRDILKFYESYGYAQGNAEWKALLASVIQSRVSEFSRYPGS